MLHTCTIEGCYKPVKAKKLCSMHHQRWLRTGDPLYERKKLAKQQCSWKGCKELELAKGYCRRHYMIKRNQSLYQKENL